MIWQKEEAPAARPELPPSQLGGFAMRQAIIGLGPLTARSLRCSKREARRVLNTGLQESWNRRGRGSLRAGDESAAALFLTRKLKTIGSERPFRGASLWRVY